jgi:hypothetical protein
MDYNIGKLNIYTIKDWNRYKNYYPISSEDIDYAVVKELDDKYVLVDQKRLSKVIGSLQKRRNVV